MAFFVWSSRQSQGKNVYQKGISLLETAAFIAIMALMMMGGSKVYDVKQSYDRQKITADNLQVVKASLEKYRIQNKGKLPCVASRSASPHTAGSNFGRSIGADCTTAPTTDSSTKQTKNGEKFLRIGTIPTRELGLPDAAMIDGWGNRLVYVVTEAYALDPARDDQQIDPEEPGAISLLDTYDHPVTSASEEGDEPNVIYTVFSLGADKRGAYNANGQLLAPCGSGASGENCNDDATFKTSLSKTFSGSNKFAPVFVYGAKAKNLNLLNNIDPNSPSSTTACTPDVRVEPGTCPAAPPGYKSIGYKASISTKTCPDGVWGTPIEVVNSCALEAVCTPTSETRTVTDQCQQYYSGSKTQKRDYTCSGNTGTWGSWYDTANNCTPNCTPTSETRQSSTCGTGYTGYIDEHRNYTCSAGVGTWSAWYSTASDNHCVASCTPTSETRTVMDQCQAGYAGSKTQKRDYTCSGGTGTWGSWYDTANNCTPTGPVPGANCPKGDWETFQQANHTSVSPESNYFWSIFMGTPIADPNWGYEFGDCHVINSYIHQQIPSGQTGYSIMNDQFVSAFGINLDPSSVTVTASNAGGGFSNIVLQDSALKAAGGGPVPWYSSIYGGPFVRDYAPSAYPTDTRWSTVLFCGKRRLKDDPTCDQMCTPRRETRSVYCTSGGTPAYEVRDYTCQSPVSGSWGPWKDDTSGQPGPWETFDQAKHMNTARECAGLLANCETGLYGGSPNPNTDYEYSECSVFTNWYNTGIAATSSNFGQRLQAAFPVLRDRFLNLYGTTFGGRADGLGGYGPVTGDTSSYASTVSDTKRMKTYGGMTGRGTTYANPEAGSGIAKAGLYWDSGPEKYLPWMTAANGGSFYYSMRPSGTLENTEFTFCKKRRKKATSTLKSCNPTCTPTYETRDVGCGSGYTGTHTQQRDYTCSGGTGSWGGWYDTVNTCESTCTPVGTCSGNYSYDITQGTWALTGTDCPGGYAPGDNSGPKMEIPGYYISSTDESDPGTPTWCAPYGECRMYTYYFEYCQP